MALIVTLFQRSGTLDITFWQHLREDNQAAYVDRNVPEPTDQRPPIWPKLTPSGIEPAPDVEEITHRSQV